MRPTDLFALALANLRRNRTRSLMTLVGVLIGVAALHALLSYGAGLQRSARSEFNALALYNTLRVTSRPAPFDSFGDLSYRTQRTEPDSAAEVALTDSLVDVLARLDGVLAAYPEVTFPAEVAANGRSVIATAEAVPLAFRDIPSYRPQAGAFFTAAADTAVLLAPSMARRLGFDPPTAAVGRSVDVVTALLDVSALQGMPAFALGTLPIRRRTYPMRVAGLLPEDQQPLAGFFRVVLPLEQALQMQKITFFSTLDLLLRRSTTDGYAAVRVQLRDVEAYPRVRAAVEAKGVFVTSFREQFRQLERLFVIMDLALGIIGFIALLVATIGIANTMMMSVMERTREIGVMKAVGGEERDVQQLFLVESTLLGLAGGTAGLLFGWLLTILIGAGVNLYLYRLGVPNVQVFHTSLPMIAGILGVALLVSMLAGLAPARKAARVEPIEALRSA
jgi:putative ABC transport system permease protein